MARKDTDKQYNITLSEENGDQLAEYCAKNSTSRNAAMNRAVELLTLDSIRSTAPDQAAYINDFEAVIDKILIFYRQAIERSLDADERARVNVREELKGMERLSKTNEMLEAERTHLMVKNAELEKFLAEQTERVKMLEAKLAEAAYNAEESKDLKKRCAELTQEKADLIAAHNAEIAALQKENFNKILEVIKAGNPQTAS